MEATLRCILGAVVIFSAATTVLGSVDHRCRRTYQYRAAEGYTTYHSQRYTVSCGWCGWSRCARYRQLSSYNYRTQLRTSARTQCCTGWRMDGYGKCSIPICSPSCHPTRGRCVRPNVCQCNTGYHGRTCSYDINECMRKSKAYPQCDHICINTVGSYRCECHSGYALDADGHSCTDINECSMSRTQDCYHKCVNTPGSYRCECYRGYTLKAGGKECKDDNECTGMNNQCDQICINEPRGYSCNCAMGYALSRLYNCLDIDECELGEPYEDCDQICTNAVGTFTCSCNAGYELGMDKKTCIDVDECAPPMNCDVIKLCESGSQNMNCSYVDGHLVDLSSCNGGEDCCSRLDYNCTELQVCQRTSQVLTCACIDRDGHALTEVEEDPGGTSGYDLSVLRRCEKVNGYFTCVSVSGYDLVIDNEFCEALQKHNCTEREFCRNTVGGYECPCKEGYIRNDDTQLCDDIDECSTDYMNCPEGEAQVCKTSNGTILCECHQGEAIVCEGTCADGCYGPLVCFEYKCACFEGFFLNTDNKPCIGEGCDEAIHDCTETEKCVNTIGGYNCTCAEGYVREDIVNGTCRDVDECAERTYRCNHLCMNEVGNYSCSCVEGYTLSEDGYTCFMPLALSEAYMTLSQEDALDEPVEITMTTNGFAWWLLPLGIICGFVIVALMAIGRNKSARFRRGTDVPLNAFRSLGGRMASGLRSRLSHRDENRESNVYMSPPSQQRGKDAAVA
ncbi:fibrillin-1-like [Acanthaster planci]|uniref:Fibrillin-1-like n=1 Tax=Acanthaster planci TaxID=133434 RepID=A0A8B7Z6K9_ACAPL|nr:fibrillin-1-like [Acanthaster planci]XP_022101274.1 fibrillin-1-like [Acanthaster planci]